MPHLSEGGNDNRKALPPTEIADRAKKATVQVRAYDRAHHLVGEGTGFFASTDGIVVTNLHVIEDAYSLEIETSMGDVHDLVYYVTADQRRDLALLQVPVSDPTPLPLGGRFELPIGEPIYVMGNPLGQVGTFSNGLVSAHRVVDGFSLVQITAPISPGSSGGPVMNGNGEVVGVATFMLRGGQNLNYAVPVRYLRPLLTTPGVRQRFAQNLLPRGLRDGAPSQGSTGGSGTREVAPSRTQVNEDVITLHFRSVDSMVRAGGGQLIGQVVRGDLMNKEKSHHEVKLVSGKDYGVAGYCDEDCTDLDLSLTDSAGKSIASDFDDTDFPILRFVASASGTYELIVVMAACNIEPCAYGVRLYRIK